jgi:hypothetical protein
VIQKAGILQGDTAGVTLACFGLRRVVLLQDETNHEEAPKNMRQYRRSKKPFFE